METGKTARYALTVVGKDKPGIVAGTAEILFRLGCNIEDSSCTMLGGEFAMILIVSHPKPFTKTKIVEEFRELHDRMGLTTSVRVIPEEEQGTPQLPEELCVITVYGADRPGIVYRVTAELAAKQVNILDLNTKLVGASSEPVYVLMLEAALPEGLSAADVERLLEKLKKELNVEISVRIVTPVSL